MIEKRPWLYLSASSSSVESSTVNRPDTSLLAGSLERGYPEEEPPGRVRQRGRTGRRRKQLVDSDDLPLSVRIPRAESSRQRWKQPPDSDRDSDLPRMTWSAHSEIDRNWSETDQHFEPVRDLQIPHKSDRGRSQSTCARADDVLCSFSATAKSKKRSKSCRRILDSPEDRMDSRSGSPEPPVLTPQKSLSATSDLGAENSGGVSTELPEIGREGGGRVDDVGKAVPGVGQLVADFVTYCKTAASSAGRTDHSGTERASLSHKRPTLSKERRRMIAKTSQTAKELTRAASADVRGSERDWMPRGTEEPRKTSGRVSASSVDEMAEIVAKGSIAEGPDRSPCSLENLYPTSESVPHSSTTREKLVKLLKLSELPKKSTDVLCSGQRVSHKKSAKTGSGHLLSAKAAQNADVELTPRSASTHDKPAARQKHAKARTDPPQSRDGTRGKMPESSKVESSKVHVTDAAGKKTGSGLPVKDSQQTKQKTGVALGTAGKRVLSAQPKVPVEQKERKPVASSSDAKKVVTGPAKKTSVDRSPSAKSTKKQSVEPGKTAQEQPLMSPAIRLATVSSAKDSSNVKIRLSPLGPKLPQHSQMPKKIYVIATEAQGSRSSAAELTDTPAGGRRSGSKIHTRSVVPLDRVLPKTFGLSREVEGSRISDGDSSGSKIQPRGTVVPDPTASQQPKTSGLSVEAHDTGSRFSAGSLGGVSSSGAGDSSGLKVQSSGKVPFDPRLPFLR